MEGRASSAALRGEIFTASRSMTKMLHGIVTPVCREVGLTPQQMHVLVELARCPGQTPGQVCDETGILRTNFAAVFRKLEKRGLVTRTKSECDRRVFELRLTEEGYALISRVDAAVVRRYDDALADEPDEVLDTIRCGLVALERVVGKLVK